MKLKDLDWIRKYLDRLRKQRDTDTSTTGNVNPKTWRI